MRRLAPLLLFLPILPAAVAGTDLQIPLANDTEAKIVVSSCFNNLPFCGYAPIAVHISNDSARAQRWKFQFQSPVYFYIGTNSMTFQTELEVPSKSARTFKLLVPLACRGTETYFNPLGVTVSGPWTNGSSMQQFTAKRSGKPVSPFVVMSESLASRYWSQIEKTLDASKKDFAGTRCDPKEFPDDWRALIGIAGLWITGDELRLLSSGQRGALHDWVCRGGALFICGGVEEDAQFHSTGFGKVSALPNDMVNVDQTVAEINELEPTSLQHQLTQSYGADWKAAADLGAVTLSAPLLIGFMALFATVAGPVNIFVFAGRARRHRLFWTTPLISIAATALLLLLIVLQDGFGGSGRRVALVYVSPAERQDVVLQEQGSRTGVVLSSSFRTRDPCFIAPIVLGTPRSAPKRQYQNSETHFSGQWFVSRSLQSHWIESIAPSRAGIVMADAGQIDSLKGAPIIVSNISGVLEQVCFRDENGHGWSARNVHTGQRVTLESNAEMPDLLPLEAGARLRTMWERVNENKNYFYAITRNNTALVATLPSIRWKSDQVIYTGPLSAPGRRLVTSLPTP